MDTRLLKVADNNLAGILVVGQIPCIATGLAERGQQGTIQLLVAFCKVNVPSLLLNQDAGGFNVAINEAGMAQFNRNLKGKIFVEFLNP